LLLFIPLTAVLFIEFILSICQFRHYLRQKRDRVI